MSLLRRAAVFALPVLAAGGLRAAGAHETSLTSARIALGADRTVRIELAMKGSDADRAAGTAVFDAAADRVVPEALAGAADGRIAAYVLSHVAVGPRGDGSGEACRPGAPAVRADGDGVAIAASWSCPAEDGAALIYRSTLLTDVEPRARQVVLVHGPAGESQALLTADENEVALTDAVPLPTGQVLGRYLAAGIEHIFLGYDHVAFLLAVVLWARRLWPVAKIVTAFTLAHSVTLSLATLGLLEVPPAVVEPAIAASIVFVAVENFLSRDVEGRWRVAFLFGLVHGLGFASALRELGLPRGALATALAAFNLGVEVGQVAIVALAVPALLALDRLASSAVGAGSDLARRAPVVHVASGAIALLGCYWFLARTVLA